MTAAQLATDKTAADRQAALRARMAADPTLLFETVAKEEGVTVREVVEALPVSMVRSAPGAGFADALTEIAGWGDVTIILNSDDGIMEFTGPVPKGELGRGYFNLMARTGFHGHLKADRCVSIAFVERPFMTRATASILFVNPEGGFMFKLFLGRDAEGQLRADQLTSFRALADRLGAR